MSTTSNGDGRAKILAEMIATSLAKLPGTTAQVLHQTAQESALYVSVQDGLELDTFEVRVRWQTRTGSK